MLLNSIFLRLKSDLFKKDINEYEKLLNALIINRFQLVSLKNAFHKLPCLDLTAALRHDVDINDLRGNQLFFKIEQKLDAKATYYFRLCTVDKHSSFIKELLLAGFEVGYHFEEPANYMKKNQIKSLSELKNKKKLIQDLISKNIRKFEKKINNPVYSISSHGDWINRKYNFCNWEFIDDEFLKKNNLEFEAYQPSFLNNFDRYISDTGPLDQKWRNNIDIHKSLEYEDKSICMLTHERSFNTNLLAIWESNLIVLIEKITYFIFSKIS